MKFSILLFLLLLNYSTPYQDSLDNEFAEFEEFEVDDDVIENNPSTSKETVNEQTTKLDSNFHQIEDDDDDIMEISDDDSEFEHFQDVEEFEGYDQIKEDKQPPLKNIEETITFTQIPYHFRDNWDSYYLEYITVAGILVYFINYLRGKHKNNKIATTWFLTHKQLLEENFAMVGDDGNLERNENVGMVKETQSVFTLWCSGRTCCEGMLVELKLIKRQDLVAIIAGMMRPTIDQLHVSVRMNKEDMDSFVFCVATKKTAAHLVKELADLSVFCPDRKSAEKYNLPSNFNVMSELPEATSAMFDSKITTIINKYAEFIDYIHFSDQYTGPKPSEEERGLKLPDTEKVLHFGFNIPFKRGMDEEATMEYMKPLMVMVFYCIEKVKRFRLSKDAKARADKNRQRVEEAFLKSTHQARAEAAAARREEKRRQEKEKVMADDDPERQRRWEIKEEKRQAKKRAPKMKQLKVKAL